LPGRRRRLPPDRRTARSAQTASNTVLQVIEARSPVAPRGPAPPRAQRAALRRARPAVRIARARLDRRDDRRRDRAPPRVLGVVEGAPRAPGCPGRMIEHPALGRPFGRRNRLRLGYRPSRLELLLLCAALAAAGVGAAVVPLAFGGGDAAALPDGREATVGLAELAPERPSFGDPVEATLAVAADRRLVDVATITPVLDWRQYGDVSVGRSVSGDGRTAIVRFRFRLECLER